MMNANYPEQSKLFSHFTLFCFYFCITWFFLLVYWSFILFVSPLLSPLPLSFVSSLFSFYFLHLSIIKRQSEIILSTLFLSYFPSYLPSSFYLHLSFPYYIYFSDPILALENTQEEKIEIKPNKSGNFFPENTLNTEIDNGNAAIGGALIDCLYLHHERLAEVFRFFDKDNRWGYVCVYVYVCSVV